MKRLIVSMSLVFGGMAMAGQIPVQQNAASKEMSEAQQAYRQNPSHKNYEKLQQASSAIIEKVYGNVSKKEGKNN